MMKYIKLIIPGLILFTAIVSCRITKPYQSPEIAPDSLFREAVGEDTTNIARIPWTSLFTDLKLQSLISEGLANNLDLKTAIQQINQAQAAFRQSKLAFFPNLETGLSNTRNRQSEAALNFPSGIGINLNTNTYQWQLSTSWEADIWGKLKSSKRVAFAQLLQSEAGKRAVQTQLVANIALSYYTLLALDQQLAITEKTLENRKQDVETMKALKESATVTGAAVVQSEANRYAAEVSIPDLKQSIREAENALCILLGRAPGKIDRSVFDEQRITVDLNIGVPTQLLQYRPDVQQAEYAFRAAFENTNLARTYFYPSLTVTASGGLSSLNLADFFNNSIFYSLVGGLTQPIFDRGQNKARLTTAQAQQLQALYSFEKSLLTAGQEVSDALFSYQSAAEKKLAREKQLDALRKSVEFTKALLHYSSQTNYTDVLTSEQSLLAAELSAVNDNLQQLQAVVNLYRALGGGLN